MEKFTSIAQLGIYITVLIVGLGISWGAMSSKLSSVEKINVQVTHLENRLRDLEIKQSGESEILNSIKTDISEIKDELKKFTKGR